MQMAKEEISHVIEYRVWLVVEMHGKIAILFEDKMNVCFLAQWSHEECSFPFAFVSIPRRITKSQLVYPFLSHLKELF
jgi:hypothetical protein